MVWLITAINAKFCLLYTEVALKRMYGIITPHRNRVFSLVLFDFCLRPCCQINSQIQSSERIILSKLHIAPLCTNFIRQQTEGHPGNFVPCSFTLVLLKLRKTSRLAGAHGYTLNLTPTFPLAFQIWILKIVSLDSAALCTDCFQWRYAEHRSLWLRPSGHITPELNSNPAPVMEAKKEHKENKNYSKTSYCSFYSI